jgi:hypothetical protein
MLFAAATLCYGSYSTIANVLPSDLFFPESVASVSGFSGSGAAIGTIIVFELAGHISDAHLAMGTHLFDPLMVLAGLLPFVGMILVLLLVCNTRAIEEGLVRKIRTAVHSSPVARSEYSGKSRRQIRYKAMGPCSQFVDGRGRRNVQRLVVCVTPGEVRRLLRQDDRA